MVAGVPILIVLIKNVVSELLVNVMADVQQEHIDSTSWSFGTLIKLVELQWRINCNVMFALSNLFAVSKRLLIIGGYKLVE